MGIAYNTSIVRDGLVLHLDAANVKSYPGSGTTWSDLSGNNNHGSLVNSPSYNSGESFSFDGTNDGVNCGDVDFGPVFSISIWFKGDPSQPSTFCGLSCKDGSGNFGAGGLYGDSTSSYVRFGFIDGISQLEISNSNYNDLRSTSWVNYVGTYNQSSLKLFRNTIQIATGAYTQTPVSTNDPYALGYRPTSGDNHFKGTMGITTVYNKALLEAEIQQNFEALRGRYGI